jgi:hypothetical protein
LFRVDARGVVPGLDTSFLDCAIDGKLDTLLSLDSCRTSGYKAEFSSDDGLTDNHLIQAVVGK